jgi:hypothetical protein
VFAHETIEDAITHFNGDGSDSRSPLYVIDLGSGKTHYVNVVASLGDEASDYRFGEWMPPAPKLTGFVGDCPDEY